MKQRLDWLAVGLIVVAMARVAATLSILSATTDEPVHVTAGIELLLQHRYTLNPENPPLPRLLFAAPLIAAGVDFLPEQEVRHFVGRTLYSRGHYRTNLVIVRAANLLFFALAALCVWRIARRELGPAGGALASLLFTVQPLILGFAGIANHDMPSVAGTALSLLAFVRWLERRTPARALLFGLAFGLALGFKFSCGPFVAAGCVALAWFHRKSLRDWRALPIMFGAALFALGASYGFRVDFLLAGIARTREIVNDQADVYALGRWGKGGWWWYFPLAVAVKTTIASLLLAVAMPSKKWLAVTAAMLLTVLPARMDVGVRYVLPVYVPLTLAAAAGALALSRRWRFAAAALLAWHCATSLLAHPQYVAYFNAFAGRDPSRVLVDSNLDWGQDAILLKRVLRENHVSEVGIALVGMHDYGRLGYPPIYHVSPDVPATGWVAVSDHLYRLERYRWLRGRPYRRVGASIRLYFIPYTAREPHRQGPLWNSAERSGSSSTAASARAASASSTRRATSTATRASR